jgi:hypothetical protein
MIGEDWYRYLAATNQGIVEARARIEKQKARIDEFKQEGRSSAGLIVRLRLLEHALQELAARRERILRRVRTYPLPTDDHGGAGISLTGANLERPQNHVDRIRCPAIEGLSGNAIQRLHKT